MRVIDIENISEAMHDQPKFVLHCEEIYRDKISAAAATILSSRSEKPFVALTGPSGSGKTTTAMRLRELLEEHYFRGVPWRRGWITRNVSRIRLWQKRHKLLKIAEQYLREIKNQ